MKFGKGDSVEALRREHDRWGTWFPGTIVSINGDDYVIGYEFLVDQKGKLVLEKIPREDVRPQPVHHVGKKWRVGDMAEVFDAHCWRVGKVAKALQRNWFVIRLFGSIQLKEFHESNLRTRQAWHNNKWSEIGKVAEDKQFSSQKKSTKLSSDLVCGAQMQGRETDFHPFDEDVQDFCEDEPKLSKLYSSSRKSNRSRAYCGDIIAKNQAVGGNRKKTKMYSCEQGPGRPLKCTLPLFKQVGNISSSKVMASENPVEMDAKLVKPASNHSSSTSYGSNDGSNLCSVASCSSNKFADALGHNFHESLDLSNDSDAESSSQTVSAKGIVITSTKYKLKADIHELELGAYNSTLRALYASGPLSWEQESLLTNLRVSLNISDEEHLFQLRHLLSSQVM